MQDLSLSALQAFAAVAEHKGFRRAAADLGMSPSALSHAVGAMEARLGTRLLNRTTRSVAVTDAGTRLLERLRPALHELDSALREASDHTGAPHGTVRLNVSRLAAMTVLGPRMAEFLARYPEIRVDVTVEDAMTDIVARGFDAGVRLGEQVDRDMIAVAVGPQLRMRAVAAPSYLATHPAPSHPDELSAYACLRFRYPTSGALYRWMFEKDGNTHEVEPPGRLTSSDMELLTAAAIDGAGVLYTVEAFVQRHIETGRLVPILTDWCPAFPGFSMFYPSRRQMPPPLRVLIDFMRS